MVTASMSCLTARDPEPQIEYGALISALGVQGVWFEVWQITMKRRPGPPFRHGYNDRRAGVVSTGPSLIDGYSWVQAALTAFSLEMPSILSAAVS